MVDALGLEQWALSILEYGIVGEAEFHVAIPRIRHLLDAYDQASLARIIIAFSKNGVTFERIVTILEEGAAVPMWWDE